MSTAIVHSGGIGTSIQAMAAGKPQLIVPLAHNQNDNARRIQRCGIGRKLMRNRYSAGRVAKILRQLMNNVAIVQKLVKIQDQIKSEDVICASADEIENFICVSMM